MMKLFRKKSYVLGEKHEIYEITHRQSKALGRLSQQMNAVAGKIYFAKTEAEQARLNTRLEDLLEQRNQILKAKNIRKIKLPRTHKPFKG